MIASDDVRRVTFEKAMRGYRCEDVDDYLKQVADSIDSLAAENDDMQKKLQVLAQRIEQYRAEEDTLHTALINAQRLGENVIKEAKQKAAEVIRASNIRAEDREQRARDEVELSQQELTTMKRETSEFKRTIMDMYRKHIELLSNIPEYAEEQQENGAAAQRPAPAAKPVPTPAVTLQPPIQQAQPAVQRVEPAPALRTPEPEPEPAEPDYDEEEDLGEEKIDTVEFAIAPRADLPQESEDYEPPFQPGAGLYDDLPQKGAPAKSAAHGKAPAARSRKKKEPAAEAMPAGFDSFSGVDFDS